MERLKMCIRDSFMADGFEAWSDWRRFDIPKLEVGPVCTTIDHIPYCLLYTSDGRLI